MSVPVSAALGASLSASDALTAVIVRTFAVLRVLGLVTTALYLAVWWSWYGRHPLGLAAALLELAWGLGYVALTLRRGLGSGFVLANVGAGAAGALAAGAAVPAVSVGGAGTWVYLGCAHAALVAGAMTSRRVFAGVLVTLCAALVGGVGVAGWLAAAVPTGVGWTASAAARAALDPGGAYRRVAVSVLLVTCLSLLTRFGVGRLRATAGRADGRLRAAADHERAETIAAARARAERERERVLHDTVLNTLAGIAWGGGDDARLARTQAEDAIAAVQGLLDGPAGTATRSLDARLDAVADAARLRGLRVRLGRTGSVGMPGSPLPGTASGPDLPAEVAAALAAATAELLSNVRRHAGTGQAWVTVHRTPTAVGVMVRDEGRGFDPAAVPPDRLGLSRSVQARLAEVGGRVRLAAAPGRGTRVLLTWARTAPPADPGAADGPPGWAGSAAVRRASSARQPQALSARLSQALSARLPGGLSARPPGELPARTSAEAGEAGPRLASAEGLRDVYTASLRRAVAFAAVIWYPFTGPVLLVLPGGLRTSPAAIGLWLLLGAAVVVVTRRVRRRPATRLEALGLVACGLAVMVATAALVGTADPGASRVAAWPVLVLPLLLMQVTVSRPAVEWIAALGCAAATLTGVAVFGAVPGPLPFAQLLSALNALAALQIMAAMGGPVLRRSADAAARALGREARLAAGREAEVRIRTDRARTLGMIEREVLPLLAAVRDGLLDPRDPAVRERCRRFAAMIRRTLVASHTAALGDLATALFDAESRGVRIDAQVAGDLRVAPAPVRARLEALLPRVLQAIPGPRALLTLICDATGGSLTLTAAGTAIPPDWARAITGPGPGAPGGAPRPGATAVAVSADGDDGQLCLQMSWVVAAGGETDPAAGVPRGAGRATANTDR
ncbi:sensor histidine kinase [Frankia sp. ACN1ag]|uniref:sensor histidine kinase n=1 Tax=Frankia sp. ACN1ag TaxID=102891 RepID=UPI0006DC98B0|nr:sensor histidine kinase [Frankia sp. ACN1ag]KQC38942.1 histidine kinase [Frankia sp. ACN1ag]